MAGIDYYSCDVCYNKTFNDTGLSYRVPTGEAANENPFTGKQWPQGNVGFMLVLCRECASKYKVILDGPEE